MGRLRRNTQALNFRVDSELLLRLQKINPAITTQDINTQETKFRHGALGKYMSRLITEDIEKREARRNDDILKEFSLGGNE